MSLPRSIKALVALLVAFALLVPSVSHAASTRLTFEAALDGAPIAEDIPGLRFSVTGGGDWFYGDARSDRYDAPYPRGAFAVDGSGFAWIGERVGEGRIDFTAGTASFFAAVFSAKESVSIRAYGSDGRELGAQVLRANADTGRLASVRLVAPVGRGIAYVLISGTRNRWILDNLETDAPLGQADEQGEPALVTVVQRPTPKLGAPVGSVVTSTIVTTNRGRGMASNTVITLPFDPAKVQVLDARFSREGAWVSQRLTNTVEIETGPLGGNGDTVTATLRMAVLPGVAVGTPLGERLRFRWGDRAGGGGGQSNLPLLAVAAALSDPATYPFSATPAAGQGNVYTVSSPIFAPGEPVALWYDTPSGESIAVGTVRTDGDGALTAEVRLDDPAPGAYLLVAQGQWTNFTATQLVHISP